AGGEHVDGVLSCRGAGLVAHLPVEGAAQPLHGEGHGVLLLIGGGGHRPWCGRSRAVRGGGRRREVAAAAAGTRPGGRVRRALPGGPGSHPDRKSTRLNSSHVSISYAVFCLKKKSVTVT